MRRGHARGYPPAVVGEAALDMPVDFTEPPFRLPAIFARAVQLLQTGLRTFPTSSVGRLFDTAAALLGFTRPITFEGQAAIWLEQLARRSSSAEALPFAVGEGEIDWRPALDGLVAARRGGADPADVARAFHRGLARATVDLLRQLVADRGVPTAALSGGVFQNELLLADVQNELSTLIGVRLLVNRAVPASDGGISLGQAALATTRAPAASGSTRPRAPCG